MHKRTLLATFHDSSWSLGPNRILSARSGALLGVARTQPARARGVRAAPDVVVLARPEDRGGDADLEKHGGRVNYAR